MTAETANQLDSLVSNRKAMISELETWSEQDLRFKPNGAWNALQVVDHIINSEKGTLGYMMKKTMAKVKELPTRGEVEQSAADQLNAALKSDRKWKAPDVLPDPSDNRSLKEMVAYWEGLQLKMREFTSNLDAAYDDKLIFRHPLSGRLDMEQTVTFLANHIEHHMHQIERIKAEIK